MSTREKIEKGWIRARIIIEIVGKPSEYVDKALEMVVEKLAEDKNLEIIEKALHKAEEIQNKDKKTEVFSAFSEIEIIVSGFSKLIEIIYDYMPSSVEIIEPSAMNFKIDDANALLNDLATRLHYYDALLKRAHVEIQLLQKKIDENKKE